MTYYSRSADRITPQRHCHEQKLTKRMMYGTVLLGLAACGSAYGGFSECSNPIPCLLGRDCPDVCSEVLLLEQHASIEFTLEYIVDGSCTVSSASGETLAFGNVVGTLGQAWDNWCGPPTSFQGSCIDTDVELDSDEGLVPVSSIAMTHADVIFFQGDADAIGRVQLPNPNYSIFERTQTNSSSGFGNLLAYLGPGCQLASRTYSGGVNTAAAAFADLEIGLDANCGVHLDATLLWDGGLHSTSTSCGGAPPSPAQPGTVWSVTIEAVGTTVFGFSTTVVWQGVLAVDYDLDVTGIGGFDGTEVVCDAMTGDCTGNQTETIITLPRNTRIASAQSYVDTFTAFDGDLDGDGDVCVDDQALMGNLVGTTISVAHVPMYTARADFDLDGTISATDSAAFAAVYNALPDCNANGNPDACDIAAGTSIDNDGDGVPDECAACESVADCADTDGDGVRDDPCLWYGCVDNLCVVLERGAGVTSGGTKVGQGDMGELGSEENDGCVVDGACDVNDAFHALNCFGQTSPCEDDAPNALNVDAVGFLGSCTLDGVCDINDYFAALNCFANVDPATQQPPWPCSCSEGPSPDSPGGVPTIASIDVRIETQSSRVQPGHEVGVEFHSSTPLVELAGYQFRLVVSGGSRGTIELREGAMDANRLTPFGASTRRDVTNTSREQIIAVRTYDDGSRSIAPARSVGKDALGTTYLGEVILQVSDDAQGTFVIDILPGEAVDSLHSVIYADPVNGIGIDQVIPAVITVETDGSSSRRGSRD